MAAKPDKAAPVADTSYDEMDEDTKLRSYKAWFRADREHSAAWRKQAKEDFDFLAGEQWTEQDKATLRDQMRPIITFNRTNPIINSISGMEINNRQEVKFFPREAGDAAADEVLTSAAEWFRDLSNADDEDSDMFLDSSVCGLGGTETNLSFDDEADGEPYVSCINPLELYWDHGARKKNYTDATRKWRVRKVPVSRAKELAERLGMEDFSVNDLDANWAMDDGDEEVTDRERARLYADEGDRATDRDEDMVTIVHLQHITRETVWTVTDPQTGQKTEEIPDADYQKLKKRADAIGMQLVAQKSKAKRIRTCIIGSKILLDTVALCPKDFSFQFVTAYIDRNTGLPYGMMRIMKDPQRWANKWMSQAMHILNTNAKGGVMVEEDAVEDVRDFEKTWARNDKVTVVASGALSGSAAKIQPKNQPSMDGSFFNMMTFAIQSVRDVTGVSLETMGMREATQAASLEAARRQAGAMGLQPLFDNLKRYRRDEGKCMLYIIQKVIPKIDQMNGNQPRLIRIVGEEGAKYVPLALRSDVRYDVIVDDQPVSPDRNMDTLKILAPYMGQFPPGVMLALLDLLPIPTSVKEKIKAAAQQSMQAASQRTDPAIQIAQDKSQTELKKTAVTAMAQHESDKADRDLEWKGKLLDFLKAIEVAKIGAQQSNDSAAIDAEVERELNLNGMISDHIMQANDHLQAQTLQAMQPQPQQAA